MEKVRTLLFYKKHFLDFFDLQTEKVKVVLFNGFQKKSQKTLQPEIDKALKIKGEYFNEKLNQSKNESK